LHPFVIPISGLTQGSTAFDWRADKEFFGNFENTEIFDAALEVRADVLKKGGKITLECEIQGTVTVQCDRCTEDLVLPVDTSFELEAPDGVEEWDISQDVYDYVNISLPMQRVHRDGECNPDTVKYLAVDTAPADLDEGPVDTPFAALKDLFKDK